MFLVILHGPYLTTGSGALDTPPDSDCTLSTTRITSRDIPRTQSSGSRIYWHPLDQNLIANVGAHEHICT
jgi:hypothetical protein